MNLKAALIQLPRRSDSCQQCQERFARGSDYYSLLSGDELMPAKTEALSRKDYCLPCWQKSSSEDTGTLTGSYWKSTIPKKNDASGPPLKRDEKALDLLKSAMGGNNSDDQLSEIEIFILAIFLAQRRVLIFRNEVEQSGLKYQVFEIADTEELLALKKIDLSRVDLSSIQKTLALKLS